MAGDWVALGFELTGLLPNGQPLRSVFEPVQLQGQDAQANLRNLFVTMPIVYRGQPVTLTLTVKRISEEELPNIQGRMMAVRRILRRLDPTQDRAVSIASMLHETVLGGLRALPERWQYSLTFYPANSAHRDKPELKQRQRLTKLLVDLAKEFAPILEPAETRQLDFVLRRGRERTQELGAPAP